MENFYWFPLNGGQFLSQTILLNSSEVGCYVLLMVYLTSHERIPKNGADLKKICRGANHSSIKKALSFFAEDEKGFFSIELCERKIKAQEISFKRSMAGMAAASNRWGKKR